MGPTTSYYRNDCNTLRQRGSKVLTLSPYVFREASGGCFSSSNQQTPPQSTTTLMYVIEGLKFKWRMGVECDALSSHSVRMLFTTGLTLVVVMNHLESSLRSWQRNLHEDANQESTRHFFYLSTSKIVSRWMGPDSTEVENSGKSNTSSAWSHAIPCPLLRGHALWSVFINLTVDLQDVQRVPSSPNTFIKEDQSPDPAQLPERINGVVFRPCTSCTTMLRWLRTMLNREEECCNTSFVSNSVFGMECLRLRHCAFAERHGFRAVLIALQIFWMCQTHILP